MRILYLVPTRALSDPNTEMVHDTLMAAGHDVTVFGARKWPTPLGKVLELNRKAPRIEWQPDVVLCRDLDTLEAGIRVSQRRKARLVYWAHDVYEHMVESDVPATIVRYLVNYERNRITKPDALIAANPGIVEWWNEIAPKDGIGIDDPIALVVLCRNLQPYTAPPNDRRLCYLGTLHKNRFTKEMVTAMKELDARLVVAGPRTNGLYEWVRKNAGPRVSFLGTIRPEEVIQWTAASDVVVTMLNPVDKCLRVGLANKLFDAMSVGRAAIGTMGTATGNLITATKMGLTTMYSLNAFIMGTDFLLAQDTVRLGKNAYEACKREFNWKMQSKTLLKVFDGL